MYDDIIMTEDETLCSSCETILYLGNLHGKCPGCDEYICVGCRDNAPFECGKCDFKSDNMLGAATFFS